jgi:hypothetical protein
MKIIRTANYKESKENNAVISNSVKTRINIDLQKNGLDENRSWEEIGPALSEIHRVLSNYDVVVSDILVKDLFMEEKGRRTFSLERQSNEPFMPGAEIENSMLVVSWYPKNDRGIGVLAYVS